MDKENVEHMCEHDDAGFRDKEPASAEYSGDAIDPIAEKRLVRKIDLFILPCMWIMYLLSYMDRTKYGP